MYRINENLTLISGNVKEIQFDPAERLLSYTTSNEFNKYDFNENKSFLITRSTDALSTPAINSKVNYGFYTQNNQILRGVEIGSSDRTNNYELKNYSDIKRVFTQGDYLYILSASTLFQLKIH